MSDLSTKSTVQHRSDVVNYASAPTAPLIIPIIVCCVLGATIICLFINFIRRFWDKHHKSDTYFFRERNDEEAKLHYTVDPDCETDPKLINTMILMTERRGSGLPNGGESPGENGARVNVEASVHDSSAETNETSFVHDSDEEDDDDSNNNASTAPLSRAPIAATESDV